MVSHTCSVHSIFSIRKNSIAKSMMRDVSPRGIVLLGAFLATMSAGFSQTWPAPSAVSFDNQVIGQSSVPLTVTIKNSQSEPLAIRSITIGGGTAPSDFTAGGNCPLSPNTLAPKESCQISVTFTPSASGLRSSTLRITDSRQNEPRTIALAGTGVVVIGLAGGGVGMMQVNNIEGPAQVTPAGQQNALLPQPQADSAGLRPATSGEGSARGLSPLSISGNVIAPLTLSPVSLAFASDTLGISSAAQSVVITNHANKPYTLESSSATGDFAITGGTCSSTLSAGQSCSIAVTFTPSVVGTRAGTLTLATSASSNPLAVTLTGVGNVNGLSSITVTPANTTINSGLTQQFTATGNFAGGRSQNLTASVQWLSSASGVASISSSGLATGASGGSTTITATFAAATPFAGFGASPISVSPPPISGSTTLSVTSSIPGATLSPLGTLIFNEEIQGNTSPSMTVTLTNNGTATLSISSIQITGPNSGDFNMTGNTCGSTLSSTAGSNSCVVTLTFKPQGTGNRNASLVFTDNAGNVSGSQQSAPLGGEGLLPLSINNTSPPDAVVGTGYEYQLTASGGTGVYTSWALSLAGGQTAPSCLRLSGSGYLVGNPLNTCIGSFAFNVKVTDSEGNQFTGTINLNIDPAQSTICESGNESVLQGQYAFSEIGFHNTGFFARVGSFVANGAGTIVGGEFDRNAVLGSSTTGPTAISGTYSVGQDNRGCATFSVSGGGSFTWRFVLSSISGTPATAAQGRTIEFDAANGNAYIASGQLFQQTTSTTATASSFSALSGNYVHLMTGWDTAGNGGRIACDGVESDSAGSITNGEQYCNDQAGTLSGFGSGLGGSYTGADQYGRFTESFGTTINLTGYMTSTAATGTVELTNSISSSDAAVLAGQTFQQQSPGTYGQGSLNSNGVYYANGLESSTSGTIEFALVSADGSGTLTINADYKNAGGSWINNGTTGSCSYTFEGNGNGGASSGCGGMFYLYAPNTAVVVNNDSGSSAGYVLPQTVPGGGFTPASVVGAFTGGTAEILSQSATAEESAITLAAGAGNTLMGVSIEDDISTNGEDPDQINPFSGVNISSTGVISETQGATTEVLALAVDGSHFISNNNTDCSGAPTCFPTLELDGPSVASNVAVAITSPSSPQSVQAGTTLGLTVAVTGTSGTGVTWTINGVTANLSYGTITGTYPSFTYTAPNRVPQPATFTLTATSNADMTQSASLTVTITAPTSGSTFAITTTSLPNGTVGTQYFQNIQTTGGILPISWSVVSGSLPPLLFLQGEPNGLETITGNLFAAGSYTFTVKATDSTTPTAQTATQQLTVVINPIPLSIFTTSLPSGTVGVPYAQAVVASGGTPPYTFSVASGSPPAWATLDSSTGVISGTPTTNGTTIFSVKVTDSTTPTHLTYTQSLSLTVTTPEALACEDSGNEAILSGQYAFSLTGFNSLGYQGVIGSFTADGSGHITAGEIDTNGILGSGNYAITTASSSYSVGSDNLGCATLATSFGTFNVRMSLGTFASSVATAGRLVEWDAPGSSTYFSATGVLKQQTAADFSGGLPTGSSYAFALSGYESVPAAVAGTFNVNGSSTLNDLEEDENVDGTVNGGNGPSTPYTGYTGTYSTFDSNGRATYSLQNGATSEGSGTVYMVSTADLLDLAANKYLEGELVEQTVPNGGFSASSVSGNMAVYLTSLNSGSQGSVTLGLLDGNGSNSMAINLYQGQGGTWQTPISVTCAYSVGANGRMTLSGTNCESTPIFYLISTDTAFALGTDTSMSFGQGEAQTGGPFGFSTIAGSYYFGDSLVINNNVTVGNSIGVGSLVLTSSGGASGYSDYSGPGGQDEDTPLSGSLAAVNSNGTINFAMVGTVDGIVISSTKFILVDNETETYPILLILKQ